MVYELMVSKNIKVKYRFGTMIETPRACFISDDLANMSDFFSYGTNDLTQLTCGISRDDAGNILTSNQYYKIIINIFMIIKY